MKLTASLIAIFLTNSISLFAMEPQNLLPDLPTYSSVDLNRYLGKWFEIARKPQIFEKDCVGVTAEYDIRSDGRISVKNACRKNSCEGKLSVANGVARVVDSPNNSKLKVSFFCLSKATTGFSNLTPTIPMLSLVLQIARTSGF